MRLTLLHIARLVLAAAVLLTAAGKCEAGDLEIAQQIAENLRNGGMKHYNVGVGCKGGVVTLRGTVASEEQRQLARSIARQTKGVNQVFDELHFSLGSPTIAQVATPIQPTGAAPTRGEASVSAVMAPARLRPFDLAICWAIAAARHYLVPDAGRFDIALDDGSRIVARAVRPARFQLKTDLGTMTVPLKLVESIERIHAEKSFHVTLSNGDRITGRIEVPEDTQVHLIAAHGEMRVSPNAIISVSRRSESPRIDQTGARY